LVAQKGHTVSPAKVAKRAQIIDFIGGERGTRTLDLGIMSAILALFRPRAFCKPLFLLDAAVQHFPLFSLLAAQKPAQ